LKAEEILLACPKCGRWPMVAIERKLYWSPRPVFKFVCVVCDYQHNDTPNSSSGKPKVLEHKR
jgi:C4-type Zn-finger protein